MCVQEYQSSPRCEIVSIVSRRLIVIPSSCTHWFCVALAFVQHSNAGRPIFGYCDHGMRANLLGVSFAYEGFRSKPFRFTDRLFALPTHFRSKFRHESIHARVWSSVNFVQQKIGLLPRSNTRRTLDGVSGLTEVINLIRKIVVVRGRTTSQVATKSRLGELHRLLNNRKGRRSANYKKDC